MNYKEGEVYTIDGKKQIYQIDGTFRDADIAETPKPDNYVPPQADVPVEAPATPSAKTVTETIKNENPRNPGITTYYSDGTSQFVPAPRNSQGLTVDEMVNYNPPNPNATADPASSDPNVVYNPDGTRSEYDRNIDDYMQTLQPKTQEEIDAEEEKIRQEKLKRQQAEIDAINQMYVGILNEARTANQGRENSTYAIQALTGERGSKSGSADVDKTQKYNQDVINSIQAEKAARISQIMNDYEDKIDAEILEARKLRNSDAEAWIDYQSHQAERDKLNSAQLRKSLLASDIKGDEIDDETWQRIANAGGYSVEQAKALYDAEYDQNRAEYVQAERDALAETEKAELERAKIAAETEKILADATSSAEEKERLLIKEGYTYMDTPAQRDQYKKQGRIMVNVNGRTYMAPKEEVETGGAPEPPDDEDLMVEALGSVSGADGFVSPADYLALRNAWVSDGNNPTTFDTRFRGFRNPANNEYITQKEEDLNF